jgi:hypothetical protein
MPLTRTGINGVMDDHAELEGRLRALGRQPVDAAVQAAHLRAIATAEQRGAVVRRVRWTVALAATFVVGSTGLAAAGVSAGPVTAFGQQLAGVVGVDINNGTVTHGTTRHYGPECVPVGDGKGAMNHGQYLKWIRHNRPELLDAAKTSNCGKPLTDDNDPEPDDDAGD